MVTWMANWIRLPARQSNSTYGSAITVSKPTKRMLRSFVRSARQPLITRHLPNYVSEFNSRCEKRSVNDHREAFYEIYRRYFGANRQNGELFLSEHNGAGWHLPLPSSWPLSPPLT